MTHTILIKHEIFDDRIIEVTVQPPPAGIGHDREFFSLPAAREYADRLAEATGWELRDLCGDET